MYVYGDYLAIGSTYWGIVQDVHNIFGNTSQ